jgi:hypothetical protein
MLKLLLLLVFLVSISQKVGADSGKFIINTQKGVAAMSIRDLHSAWDVVKLDYPSAKAVFMYNSKTVSFCVFDLMRNDIFLIFYSPTTSPSIFIKVESEDKSNEVKDCFVMLSSIFPKKGELDGDRGGVGEQWFGKIFSLREGQECELRFKGNFNHGNYLMHLNRKSNGWWEGSATISHRLTIPTPK